MNPTTACYNVKHHEDNLLERERSPCGAQSRNSADFHQQVDGGDTLLIH